MKPSSAARQPSPLPLRVLHGLVFGGFTAMCLAAGWPELEHLVRTQLQPFHPGPPPRPELLLPMLAALVGMAAVLVQHLRGRAVRLAWSLLILGALVLTLWGQREGLVAGRTADSANVKILEVARKLHEGNVNALRSQGAVSENVGTWQSALEQVSHGEPSPVRTRSFEPLPFRIRKIESPEALPPDAPPGTLMLYVMPGGFAYALHPVGVSPTGEPWPLHAPDGAALVFHGAVNP
ncbi:hypothetical protein [Archangium violaceum]|uniref:Uncharacterized protein n=1 Tax=Archangium violaceum Cb vi76 TaxID=1406225 RepID=A0A084T1L2_9BACT|nr:hypothetical protein [Archangium violaceum]KFA94597.1 hypothetical protein Q664_01435 [Archangium violaceum Cb vi76]